MIRQWLRHESCEFFVGHLWKSQDESCKHGQTVYTHRITRCTRCDEALCPRRLDEGMEIAGIFLAAMGCLAVLVFGFGFGFLLLRLLGMA